ncbi:MAG: DNA polymerase III subunit beta [bacterium]
MLELNLKKASFQKELGLVQTVVERRHTIPILSHVLIESTADGITICGTDLDVSLKTRSSAEILGEGSVTVQARKLFDIVRNLPDAEIHLKEEANNRVSLRCERSRFKITGLSRENFPEIPAFGDARLVIASDIFKTAIERTVFAPTTQEESRYALSGVQLEVFSDSRLRMVATDGHRLSFIEKEIQLPEEFKELKVLVPKKALAECGRLAAESDEPVEIMTDENHIYFRVGKRQLVSRLLAGQFPNYEMVLPKENNRVVQLSGDALAAALRRVSLVSDERSRAVRMVVSPGRIDLSCRRADDDEEAREDVMANYEGEEFEMGFNSQYMLDYFTVSPGGDVRLEFKDGQGPALLRPGEDEFDYRYVVMPMRV